MIKAHKLFVDRDCPMCKLYGKLFVKWRFVDEQTISYYQTMKSELTEKIDVDRARNEIAFHNLETGNTVYGVDAIVEIISHKFPLLNAVLKSAVVYPILLLLYKFISYNRKVIYPAKPGIACSCEPDLNKPYRIAYISFVALITGLLLNYFTAHLAVGFGFEHKIYRELVVCVGQVLWQGIAIAYFAKDKFWDYLGNMSTVSLMGGILLIPLLLIAKLTPIPLIVLLALFATIITCMLLEHIRRCKLLGITLKMTASWIIFRMVALSLIILSIAL